MCAAVVGPRILGLTLLVPVHSIRRAESVPIGSHQLVPDDNDSAEVRDEVSVIGKYCSQFSSDLGRVRPFSAGTIEQRKIVAHADQRFPDAFFLPCHLERRKPESVSVVEGPLSVLVLPLVVFQTSLRHAKQVLGTALATSDLGRAFNGAGATQCVQSSATAFQSIVRS
jgi:hypothetical protein